MNISISVPESIFMLQGLINPRTMMNYCRFYVGLTGANIILYLINVCLLLTSLFYVVFVLNKLC